MVSTATFFGLGASQIVVLDTYHKFMYTTLHCDFQSDYHMQLIQVAKLTQNDCAFLISHSGKNKEFIRIANILLENNVPIIGMTSYRDSPLDKISDITLFSVAEETKYRPEVMSAMIAQITLIDSLFMIYSIADNQKNSAVRRQVRSIIKDTRSEL